MKNYNDYIHFAWNGKKYRWKKTRLFALCVVCMLVITTAAIIHVDRVCRTTLPQYTKTEAEEHAATQQEAIEKIVNETTKQVEKATKEYEKYDKKISASKSKKEKKAKEQKLASKEMPLYSNSSVKRYMDRTTVTDSSTKNYKICRNASVNDDGTLSYDGRTVIAIGQKYGTPGTKLDITLEKDDGNQHTVKAIIGDSKKYCDTENGAGWVAADGSVLEIVVDTNSINDLSRTMGDMNYTKALNGTIVSIEKL